MNWTTLTLFDGETTSLAATVNPSSAMEQTVIWTSTNSAIVSVTQDGNVTGVSFGSATIVASCGGKSATCEVTVTEDTGAIEGWVDLGLPSGTKWALYNLGASAPEEFGDYYAWGETETHYGSLSPFVWKSGKAGYIWSTYTWCNENRNRLTKYCPLDKTSYWYGTGSPDGKTVLDTEDDAAHYVLGGNWHIPTFDDWNELIDNCDWSRTTLNGINGYRGSSRVYQTRFIFLPAAGYLGSNSNLIDGNSMAKYWTSTLVTDSLECAYNAFFSSGSILRLINGNERSFGFSIRPIK